MGEGSSALELVHCNKEMIWDLINWDAIIEGLEISGPGDLRVPFVRIPCHPQLLGIMLH